MCTVCAPRVHRVCTASPNTPNAVLFCSRTLFVFEQIKMKPVKENINLLFRFDLTSKLRGPSVFVACICMWCRHMYCVICVMTLILMFCKKNLFSQQNSEISLHGTISTFCSIFFFFVLLKYEPIRIARHHKVRLIEL